MTEIENTVVFITQRYPPDKGGNATRISDTATNLSKQGWDVTVLAPPPSYPPGEFDRSWQLIQTECVDTVTVHRLWSWQSTTENPGMARRLAYYVPFGIAAIIWLLWNVRRYDIVVTTTPPISTGAPGLLASLLGKPWVVDVRDLWIDASISLGYLEAGSVIERVSRRFQRLVLHTADRITVTTEALGDSLSESYGESLESKTMVVPNGVDIERFQSTKDGSSKTAEGRAEAAERGTPVFDGSAQSVASEGKEDEETVSEQTIIYTGNLGSAQDLESCIRAMAHLSHEEATLQLVGGGDVESRLRRLTENLGLQDRVEFTGTVPQEDVPPLLRQATIGIAPLRDTEDLSYAMPTKVYEYMSVGLPTLVTGSGEVKRFIDESNGGVHADNDPERIAQQLDELLADEQLRRELGANGHSHVRAKYDRKQIARRLSDELSRLVEEDPPSKKDGRP